MKKLFYYCINCIIPISIAMLLVVLVLIGITCLDFYKTWNHFKNEVLPVKLLGESYFDQDNIFIETTYKIDEVGFKSPDFLVSDSDVCYVKSIKNDTGTFYITGIAKYNVRSGNIKECPIIEQR